MTATPTDADLIQAWITERSEQLVDLLVRLVAVETENPPGRNLRQCAELLHEEVDRLGLHPQIIDIDGDSDTDGDGERPDGACVVRGSAGSGDRLAYFHGHFDVVPVQDRAQFEAVREAGRITGRGTADMKGGLVCMMYAAAAAQELGLLNDGRIVLHFVCDEETGSTVGSGFLRDTGMIDPCAEAMLTAEQSGERIWNAAKGALSLRVEVTGRPAHVGQAHQGVNAFLQSLPIAEALGEYAEQLSRRHTEFTVGDGEAAGSMLVVGGQSASGYNFNVVPGRSWFTVDGRFNPEEDIEGERTKILSMIDGIARRDDVDVLTAVSQLAPSAATSNDHPTAELLAKCATQVSGTPARFELCAGCLDTRWYAQLGIPAFGYGPGLFEVSHSPHEYVEQDALLRVATAYALFAARLFAGPAAS